MNELLGTTGVWWLGTAIGGGAILLLASLAMWAAPTSKARQRIGEWGVVAALLVAVLRLGPAWLNLPDPVKPQTVRISVPSSPAVESPVDPPEIAMARPAAFHGNPIIVTDVRPSMVVTSEPSVEPRAPIEETVSIQPITQAQWIDVLLATYLAVGGLILGRWLLGQWALARILAAATQAPRRTQELFDCLAGEHGMGHARLLVSKRVPVPICCGIRRPTVVLPANMAAESNFTKLRWVFTHELTHLQRRDTWSTWLMGLAGAVYFFVPWYWWLHRNVRLCQEFVADAAAAAQSRWADEYAEYLVSLARSSTAPLGATGVLAKTSDLVRRVSMIVKKSESKRDWSRGQLMTGVASLMASAVIFAGLGVRADSPAFNLDEITADASAEDKKGEVEVRVVVDDDDEKKDAKDGEKKRMERKLILTPATGGMGFAGFNPFDKADFEKKLRKALENAKLSDEQVEKVMKDVAKSMEQAHMKIQAAMPQLAQLGNMHGDFAPQAFAWQASGSGQGRLGIMAEKPNAALVDQLELSKDQGLIILQVVKGSAADKAGLKQNDILLKLGDKSVPADSAKLVKIIEGLSADKEIDAIVLRKGKKETVGGIKLAEKKKPEEMARVLAKVADSDPEKAVIITRAANPEKGDKKPSRTVNVTIKDGEYSAKEVDGDTKITVVGSMDEGKVKVSSITVEDSDGKNTYKSVERVPSKFRARVQKLIANTGDSSIRFESRKDSDNR